jgi:hypothetical protein
MPAVAGGWRKGMDRKAAAYLPLTAEVVFAHLVGEVFIGLYPLRTDNSCCFLVADFDGPAAMLDALAYAKAARASAVPAALEISQSGRGAHVWVFFTEAIPAAVARGAGTALVHEATVLRGAMDLRSYDRLFPNQDVLPDGGFGNLIAAPLQGRRRRDGLTVFLDLATLEPHEDQWAFLSTLDRLSPGDAARVARRAKRAVVGLDVTTMSRSDATRVHPPLPAVVDAELGAGLSLNSAQLSPAALSTLKHAASMANPKFYELQRLRKSTWDTPRFVRGYDITVDDRLVLPRGLCHTVAGIVERAGSRLAVTDVRNAGGEIDVAFTAELEPRQSAAVSALLAHDDGVLVAPPGSGKTVMACAMIAERAASTLILVDRKALAEQWRTRIEQFLGIRPGQLGGGRRKLTGIVDIAMLPSLARRDDVADLTAGYGHVVVDECHHLAAAAYDHSVKRIAAQFWLGLTATPVRRDGLGELVTWQLGSVRHTVVAETARESSNDGQDPFIEVGPTSSGPRRLLYVHETAFRCDDLDLSSPGALAAVHHALANDEARNAQIVTDVSAALRRGRNCLVPHPTRRPPGGPDHHVGFVRAPGARAARGHVRQRPAIRREPPRRHQTRRRRPRHRHNTVPRRRLRRPRPRHTLPRRAGLLRRPAHSMRRPSHPRRTRQRLRRGPRLPRPGHPDTRRITSTAHARVPHTRLHQSVDALVLPSTTTARACLPRTPDLLLIRGAASRNEHATLHRPAQTTARSRRPSATGPAP